MTRRAYHGTADRRPLTLPRWVHVAFGIALAALTLAEVWLAAVILGGN